MPQYILKFEYKEAASEDDNPGKNVRIHPVDFEQIIVPLVYPGLDSLLCNLHNLTSSFLQYYLSDYH